MRRINILYCTCIFCTYIVWCQLKHLRKHWRRSMAYYNPSARKLKLLLTHHLLYCDTLWNDRKNVIISPDGRLFTCRMPYINTMWCYWRVICSDREFILYVTFLIIIYLKYYQDESLYRFPSWQDIWTYRKYKHEFNKEIPCKVLK